MDAPRNRYLVLPSGRFVGTRTVPAVGAYTMLALALFLAIVGSIALVFDIVGVSALAALALFVGSIIAQMVLVASGRSNVARASQSVLVGDTSSPILPCQTVLGRVFRSDVRVRALHLLGLCAQANGDFAEAADLFDRASQMIPAFVAGKDQRQARVLMLCHRAIALVATRREGEADALVRQAAQLFPPRAPALDVVADDARILGGMGVSAAFRDLEQGRDARALLTLASVVVLAARGMGREAINMVERERYFLNAGLLPRERALVLRVEARAQGLLLGGGPMRAPGLAVHVDPASDAWADRILPAR